MVQLLLSPHDCTSAVGTLPATAIPPTVSTVKGAAERRCAVEAQVRMDSNACDFVRSREVLDVLRTDGVAVLCYGRRRFTAVVVVRDGPFRELEPQIDKT